MTTPPKKKYPRAAAVEVARELVNRLNPFCDRMIIAGSLRRRRREVGDVEIMLIPKFKTIPKDMFSTQDVNMADEELQKMLFDGVLKKRESIKGGTAWGDRNKLAVHCASGIPVDIFTTTPEIWANYLVCRTGPADSNTRIAAAAQRKGWHWRPYGPGFSQTKAGREVWHPVKSEEEVFAFVDIQYREPWERY